ncbi:hypothetical protein BDZ91DRAFT_669828, partial [Kalaharituber pfeilii]
VRIAAYHPQLNGLVERGHQSIIDALAKLGKIWVRHLPAVLFFFFISVFAVSTRYAPYRLVFGQDCVLPIELSAKTWAISP